METMEIPDEALWGPQTQRAVVYFHIARHKGPTIIYGNFPLLSNFSTWKVSYISRQTITQCD
jgi:hypothetical protein